LSVLADSLPNGRDHITRLSLENEELARALGHFITHREEQGPLWPRQDWCPARTGDGVSPIVPVVS
jgi:hypothetical protein